MNADETGLLLGAGRGMRLGGREKAFLDLGNESVLQHVAAKMLRWVDTLVVAVQAGSIAAAEAELSAKGLMARCRVIAGGDSRQDSLMRLLEAAQGNWVLVHEVARPFTRAEDFEAVMQAGLLHGAAILAREIPARDSIGRAEGGRLKACVERRGLYFMQTPQVYRREAILAAHHAAMRAGLSFSSTAAVALHAGIEVHLVPARGENLKVTYPDDLPETRRE
ncbi:MAG: 2-C-methyl-D-erythritol 4-phosphate cytidylyltransferase [Verrucomicrobia bacterium]|nr:MAG: 2-C-methyl-D-erythritol 4-phosphate cytidylyltransferase [Verrucomicrobiota bacterium]